MSKAYRCDECGCYRDDEPAFSGLWGNWNFQVKRGDFCRPCFGDMKGRSPREYEVGPVTPPEPTVGGL